MSTSGPAISRAWSSRRSSASDSERPAEEQVEGLVAALIEAGGEIDGAERRIDAEEHAAVLAQIAEADLAAVHPGVAGLERDARVCRQIQHTGAAPPDPAVVHQPADAVVLAGEEAG